MSKLMTEATTEKSNKRAIFQEFIDDINVISNRIDTARVILDSCVSNLTGNYDSDPNCPENECFPEGYIPGLERSIDYLRGKVARLEEKISSIREII